MEEQLTPAAAKAAFLSIGSYTVPLSYNLWEPPVNIVFVCKMLLSEDDIAARQAFYAKPDGEQLAAKYAYEADFLARVVTEVTGLPGFEFTGQREVVEGDARRLQTIDEALREYFAGGEPILRKIATDAVQMYNRVTQPAEFFR